MYLNRLTKIETEAKQIKEIQKISYNQALQLTAKKEGFSSYQAFLNKIETDFCKDENEYIKDFKSNIFKNRKYIKSNFIKIKNLKIKYNEINNDDIYDNNETEREELLENILNKADEMAKNMAHLIFPNQIINFGDNNCTSLEVPCFNIYTSSGYIQAHNDYNGEKSDFFLELLLNDESIEIGFINLNNYKDIGFLIPEEYDPSNFNSINIKLS